MTRPSWTEYFLDIAEAVSKRADCQRRSVGAVLVNDKHHIVATGYNGTRAGNIGCLAGACPRGRLSYDEVGEFTDYSDPDSPGFCISSHAETNALLHAGQPVQGMVMYVTDQPCPACKKTLYNAGLNMVSWPDGVYDWSWNG